MRFKIIPTQKIPLGKVTYSSEDHSFDFERHNDLGLSVVTSLVIFHDYIQLDIDHTGRILWVWGLCPHQSWKPTKLLPPISMHGILNVNLNDIQNIDGEITPGVSIRVPEAESWPVFVNKKQEWVCIGEPNISVLYEAVEFASHTIAVLVEGKLKAVWLHPETLD